MLSSRRGPRGANLQAWRPIPQPSAKSAVENAPPPASGCISVDRSPGPNPLSQQWHLLELFTRYEVDGVIDVGANRGQYGRGLRQPEYQGAPLPFEPVPEAFAELAAVSQQDRTWEARNLAVADKLGTLSMNVAASSSVFFRPHSDLRLREGRPGMEVKRQEQGQRCCPRCHRDSVSATVPEDRHTGV